MVKDCRACCRTKPIDDFYRLKVGCMAVCKDCWKRKVHDRRISNLDKVRAYDRERAKLPHRIENATRVTRNWRQKHKDRLRAHNMAARAELTAPERCEGCGAVKPLDKHHPDYSKPLLVLWLCKPCHVIADKIRRKCESEVA